MPDFLKRAASLIFNVEEEEKAAAKNEDAASVPAAVLPSAVPPPLPAAQAPTAAASEKFQAYFKQLYERANLPGPDYFEFQAMTDAMGNLISDDVKYPSVFAGFAGVLTKEKLISSAQQYLKLVQDDRSEFDQHYQTAVATKVQGAGPKYSEKQRKLKSCKERLAALNTEIAALNKQSEEDEARLAAEKAAYHQQSEMVRQKIKAGLDRINQYIK